MADIESAKNDATKEALNYDLDFKYAEIPGAKEIKKILDDFVLGKSPLSEDIQRRGEKFHYDIKSNEAFNDNAIKTIMNSFGNRLYDVTDINFEDDLIEAFETRFDTTDGFQQDDNLVQDINNSLNAAFSVRHDLFTLESFERTVDDVVNGAMLDQSFAALRKVQSSGDEEAISLAEKDILKLTQKLNLIFDFHDNITAVKGTGIQKRKTITDAELYVDEVWSHYLRTNEVPSTGLLYEAKLKPESVKILFDEEYQRNKKARMYKENAPYMYAEESFKIITASINSFQGKLMAFRNWQIENQPEGISDEQDESGTKAAYHEDLIKKTVSLTEQQKLFENNLRKEYKQIYRYLYSDSKSEFDAVTKLDLARQVKRLNETQNPDGLEMIESLFGNDFLELVKASAMLDILKEDKSKGGFLDSLVAYHRRYFDEVFMIDNPQYKKTFEKYMIDPELKSQRPPDEQFLNLIDRDKTIEKQEAIRRYLKRQG